MKIKPMLARLQSAMGRNDLIDQMVLLPEPKKVLTQKVETTKSINFIVGYDASPHSHTALDIAFWIAHQTRLATNKQVKVQAVYIVEERDEIDYFNALKVAKPLPTLECPVSEVTNSVISVLIQPKLIGIKSYVQESTVTPLQEADRILWQAHTLSEEWQGSFKSHLRFGCVSTELRKVVEAESADVLFLGCQSVYHPLIETLGANFPCAILGIPDCISE